MLTEQSRLGQALTRTLERPGPAAVGGYCWTAGAGNMLRAGMIAYFTFVVRYHFDMVWTGLEQVAAS
ncbi:MAG TPA: hypothetical protein VGI74_24135 [Streptosporangiaceae bacterium]